MDTIESETLLDNALVDAEEVARIIGRAFTDDDVISYTTSGINLLAAAKRYAQLYTGTENRFLATLHHKVVAGINPTPGQARVVLNIIREELLRLDPTTTRLSERFATAEAVDVEASIATSGGEPLMEVFPTKKSRDPREEREYRCFECNIPCHGITALYEHQVERHPKRAKSAAAMLARLEGRYDGPSASTPASVAEVDTPVIAVTTSTLDLDISGLPDGRYAAPAPVGSGKDFIFLMKTTVKRPYRRTRRYRWSKYRYGGESVAAGTMEVKEWTSDAKRLLGEQKLPSDDVPNPVYRGEYEVELQKIMADPEGWAKVFANEKKRCYRCGKSLTDEESRLRGVGPECAKTNHFHPTVPSRPMTVAEMYGP